MAETTTAAETVTAEWVEEFVERWLVAWNSHQPERLLELMTHDNVYDDPAWSHTMRGHAQVRDFPRVHLAHLPRLHRCGSPAGCVRTARAPRSSRSTTPPGSRTSRSWATRRRPRRSASSGGRWRSTVATASASRAWCRQRRRLRLARARRRLPRAEDPPRTRGRTGPGPTARIERFIRAMLAGWRTGPSPATATKAPPCCPSGLTTTSTGDRTAPSATGHRPPATRLAQQPPRVPPRPVRAAQRRGDSSHARVAARLAPRR